VERSLQGLAARHLLDRPTTSLLRRPKAGEIKESYRDRLRCASVNVAHRDWAPLEGAFSRGARNDATSSLPVSGPLVTVLLPASLVSASSRIPAYDRDAVIAIGVGAVAMTVLVILLLVALAVATRTVIAGSIMVGAILGAAIGFWIGEANAPPEPYGSYRIGPSDWAMRGAPIGLLTGSILGGSVGWALRKPRRRP
jgi:hypothetical protein